MDNAGSMQNFSKTRENSASAVSCGDRTEQSHSAQLLNKKLRIHSVLEQTDNISNVRETVLQSDLAYLDPSPSGRKSLDTDVQHMPCTHTQYVCSIIRFPRLFGFFLENGCVWLCEV